MTQQLRGHIFNFSFRALAGVLDNSIARAHNILFFSSTFLKFLRSLVSLQFIHTRYEYMLIKLTT